MPRSRSIRRYVKVAEECARAGAVRKLSSRFVDLDQPNDIYLRNIAKSLPRTAKTQLLQGTVKREKQRSSRK